MVSQNADFHRQRAQQCREMADGASDPDVRRRHRELAEMHSGAAERGGQNPS